MSRKVLLLSTLLVFLLSSPGYTAITTRIIREEERLLPSEVQRIEIETRGSVTWNSIDEDEQPYIIVERRVFGIDLDAMEDYLKELCVEEESFGSRLSLRTFRPSHPPSVDGFPYLAPGVTGSAIHLSVYASPGLISDFHVQTHNGDIEVVGFFGELDLETHNGDIKLESGEGEMTLLTYNGSIDLAKITLNGSSSVRTNNGRIKGVVALSSAGNYTFETRNGKIKLEMPGDTAGSFELETRLGTIDFQLGNDVFRTRENTQLNRGEEGSSISIVTRRGNIVVREMAW